jgi:Protein of unknown function (DUF3224)
MTRPSRVGAVLVAGFCLSLLCLSSAYPQAPAPAPIPKATTMTKRASGTFEVKLEPQSPDEKSSSIGRMLLDKQFHGDLEAVSKGQMLAHSTATQGSAGYVAIEQVTGTLQGRTGTFVLQHNGLMDRGKPQLTIIVVPDSGTGQLAGLTGKMDIQIEGGKHSYVFEYTLPEAQ